MLRLASIAGTIALLVSIGMPGATHLCASSVTAASDLSPTDAQAQAAQGGSSSDKSEKAKDGPLQPASRLALVRFVDGEFARAVEPLPAGKNGFHLKAGAAVDEKQLQQTLVTVGAAVNPGDKAQITSLEFREREIVVNVNGGGRGKTRLRDRVHMEVSGTPTLTPVEDTPVNTKAGATLYLDFDKPLPDITPQQLKQYLSSLLDFSKQPSAAVQWAETLPPDVQEAVKERRAAVGMDRDTVLAAMGRPDRKVRERTSEGVETEDWIYGTPPAKTIFVEFEGDKVTKIDQYPQ